MKSRLSTTKLKNTDVEIIDGDRGVNYPKKTDFSDCGYCLFLDASNVTKNGFVFDNPQFITPAKDNQLGNGKLKRHDIVITTRGTIGNFAYYDTDIPYDNIRINSGMLILRNRSEFDTKYLYQLLKSPYIKQQIINITTGSSQPQITRAIIKELTLLKPELPTQTKISNLLHTLDKKIELNSKINAQLETLAKLIYDYWFVQFDFPDENSNSYKSSGGKMVWSNELKREIPKGWNVKRLDLLESNIVTGKTPSTADPKNFQGLVPFICIGDLRQGMHVVKTEINLSEKGANLQKNKFIPSGSICVSCIASPGLVALSTKTSQTNQQLNSVVISQEQNRYFLYFYLKDYFKFSRAKTGNTFANMNKEDFSSIKIITPNDELLCKFSKIVEPLASSILNNLRENEELTSLRDWLLPMLMNGQVKMKEN